eukprot:7014548-Pyramimonas_sp.AAC.1
MKAAMGETPECVTALFKACAPLESGSPEQPKHEIKPDDVALHSLGVEDSHRLPEAFFESFAEFYLECLTKQHAHIDVMSNLLADCCNNVMNNAALVNETVRVFIARLDMPLQALQIAGNMQDI